MNATSTDGNAGGTVIFDGQGYFVRRRRVNGSVVDLWSPKRADAAVFYFEAVARKIASTIPQRVTLRSV